MKLSALAVLAALVLIGQPIAALASPTAEKIYAPNGRRIAMSKTSNFGRKVYSENGRRVAVIRSR